MQQFDGDPIAPALAQAVPALVDEVIVEVVRAVPEYEGVLDSNVRQGVRQALGGFVESVAQSMPREVPARDAFVEFGRGELRAGRSLDALLHAYRVGAQAAWRGFSRAGDAAGLEPRVVYGLAEALFAYIDELSAASAEGYAYEQSLAARAQQEQRRQLVEALLADPPLAPEDVAAAARAAEWSLPDQLAVVAFEADEPDRVAARLAPRTVAARVAGMEWALVPDPEGPGREAELARALEAARRAAIGPAVPWVDARESARRARLALEQVADGRLVRADDHLLDLLLRSDAALADELVRRRLAPFEELSDGARARLLETLRAWLDCHGEVTPAASLLHVHVQTVRYRLGRLRELLGDALDDPQARLELSIALRLSGAGSPPAPQVPTGRATRSRRARRRAAALRDG